ncbi:hypothetical protein ACQPYE_18945 [Actinosynnema sp. CA-299493]
MTAHRSIGRIACRAVVLAATLAAVVAVPLSASAHSVHRPDVFVCDQVDDEDLPTVRANGCGWRSPVILPDPLIIQPEFASWHYWCANGHAVGTTVTGYECERRY